MFGSEGLKTNLSGIVSLCDIWLTIFGTCYFVDTIFFGGNESMIPIQPPQRIK